MRFREEKIALLELLLARPLRTPPISHEEIRAELPALVRSGNFCDVKADFLLTPAASQTAHGYILANCYVEIDGRQRLGLRLHDREEATALLADLKAWPERRLRRRRPSLLALGA